MPNSWVIRVFKSSLRRSSYWIISRRLRRSNRDFIGPNLEQLKKIGPERGANGDIGGVAAARDQYPPDAALIIARIECVPCAADVGFQPARIIHRRIG